MLGVSQKIFGDVASEVESGESGGKECGGEVGSGGALGYAVLLQRSMAVSAEILVVFVWVVSPLDQFGSDGGRLFIVCLGDDIWRIMTAILSERG